VNFSFQPCYTNTNLSILLETEVSFRAISAQDHIMLSILPLAALVGLASAHFRVLEPTWRGSSFGEGASQWIYPCKSSCSSSASPPLVNLSNTTQAPTSPRRPTLLIAPSGRTLAAPSKSMAHTNGPTPTSTLPLATTQPTSTFRSSKASTKPVRVCFVSKRRGRTPSRTHSPRAISAWTAWRE
jgi:hypothetical protein